MRKDMDKVICERPRRGPRFKYPKGEKREFQKLDPEEYPHGEKIRQKWKKGYNNKQFNEHLKPLEGYLAKQVGRPWDKIWSEICSELSMDSAVQGHLRDHVFDYVTLDVFVNENGTICDSKGFELESRYYRQQFYVCPNTKLLKSLPKYPRYRRKVKDKVIWVNKDELTCFKEVEGVWYELKLKEFSWSSKITPSDVVFKKNYKKNDLFDFYGGNYHAISKRQLNKKEIKKAGLRK